MKKGIYAFLLIVLLIVFGIWWFAVGEKTQVVVAPSHQKLKVVASGYVPYDLARQIGGDRIELSQLIAAGTEPHHFEPTPGDIIKVNHSDLFIYVSKELEPWTQDILKGMPSVSFVESGPLFEGEDPHVWMTPYGALSMSESILEALIRKDPKNKSYYKKNFKNFEEQIQSLHAAFKQGLSSCQSREMIHIGHLAFAALAKDYGLNLHALTGTSHQSEHSVRKLAGLIKLIKKNQVGAVFTEEMLSSDLANTVSLETGVQILPLYTVHAVSKEDFSQQKTYLEFMNQNLTNLQTGLRCQAL